MRGHECFHCKQWVDDGQAHDCWTTTERALTKHLSEDLQEAWQRLRETAVEFGDQRIYASHHSIMFSRTACYFFVRPRKQYLEVWVFLGRAIKAPQIRKVMQSTPTSLKRCHLLHVRHRDEVEAPMTDWLREAYEKSEELTAKARSTRGTKTRGAKMRGKRAAPKQAAARKRARPARRTRRR